MQIQKDLVLDVLGEKAPALSSTDDMPVIETTPDSSPPPAEPAVEAEPAAPETEATPDAGKTDTSESATEGTEEVPGAPEGQKKSRGVQKKLDELRREAEDAKRQVEAEREEKLRLLNVLEQRGAAESPAPEVKDEDTEPAVPNRAEYPDDEDWDVALMQYASERSAWAARQETARVLEAERYRVQQEQLKQAQQQVEQAYSDRIAKTAEKYDDFDEIARNPDVKVSGVMAEAIVYSDNGPEMQYYLGKNPAEAERIMKLPPTIQLMELGKIEAKLAGTPAPAAPTPPKISTAPPPITPLKTGDSAPASKAPEDMSMDEYKAFRKAQGAQVRQ
jgi:hypothetical protein